MAGSRVTVLFGRCELGPLGQDELDHQGDQPRQEHRRHRGEEVRRDGRHHVTRVDGLRRRGGQRRPDGVGRGDQRAGVEPRRHRDVGDHHAEHGTAAGRAESERPQRDHHEVRRVAHDVRDHPAERDRERHPAPGQADHGDPQEGLEQAALLGDAHPEQHDEDDRQRRELREVVQCGLRGEADPVQRKEVLDLDDLAGLRQRDVDAEQRQHEAGDRQHRGQDPEQPERVRELVPRAFDRADDAEEHGHPGPGSSGAWWFFRHPDRPSVVGTYCSPSRVACWSASKSARRRPANRVGRNGSRRSWLRSVTSSVATRRPRSGPRVTPLCVTRQ